MNEHECCVCKKSVDMTDLTSYSMEVEVPERFDIDRGMMVPDNTAPIKEVTLTHRKCEK